MKIILFTNTFPYQPGETFLEEEISILVNYYSNITIVPLHSGTGEIRPLPAGVRLMPPLLNHSPKNKPALLYSGIFNLSPALYALKYLFSPVVLSKKKFWAFSVAYLLRREIYSKARMLVENIDIGRYDDVMLYFYWGDKSVMLLPYLKSYYKNSKAVARFHGSDLYEEVSGCIPFRDKIFPLIDMAIPISGIGKNYILENYNDSLPQDIRVSYLGVKDYKLRYRFYGSDEPLEIKSPFRTDFNAIKDERIITVFSCSNMIPLKRVDMIIKALSLISEKELNDLGIGGIRWVHAGGGECMQDIVNEISRANRTYLSVDIMGAVKHDRIINFYRRNNVDLFIQLSRSEGVPVSMMEALCFGVPIIATNVGGVGELVEPEFGYLLDANPDITSVKNALIDFMSKTESQKEEMRSKARKSYEEKWDADSNYESFAALLTEVMSR